MITETIIYGVEKRIRRSGALVGKIRVIADGRRHTVKFERAPNGYAEQWGAPTSVLCATFKTFEQVCSGGEI